MTTTKGRPYEVSLDEVRRMAKVSIAVRKRQKEPVPQQLQDFADGKVDDPGEL